ncbi:MAG TPA: MraY family glycosyltransferase [Candidatus Limnocylindrales bacterium]|nr:MraY family glycosyltransferase [Candidatus Limnocylindrales bacterium]
MTFIEGVGESFLPIVVVFVLSAVVALLLTPLVRRTVRRYGIVDRPDARRVNTRPIPRAGGIAIAAAFLGVAVPFVALNEANGWVPTPLNIQLGDLAALFGGGLAAAIIGVLDDLYDLRARWQLLGQIGLALAAAALGIGIALINNPLGTGVIPFSPAFSVGFTVFWIVGMINSINWIDGLDGLSTGVALIASVTLGLISLTTQVSQPLIAVLCFALAGALAGFLRWNFYPAKIFTGTTGVQFVGYTLAVLAILGSAKVAVALLVLGVPIIDTFWIIVGRVSHRRSPFTPDRSHIHHRLLDLGLSHRNTVLFIYGICAALAILALLVQEVTQAYAFISLFIIAGLILFGPTRGAFQRPDELEAEAYEGGADDTLRGGA